MNRNYKLEAGSPHTAACRSRRRLACIASSLYTCGAGDLSSGCGPGEAK